MLTLVPTQQSDDRLVEQALAAATHHRDSELWRNRCAELIRVNIGLRRQLDHIVASTKWFAAPSKESA